MSTASPIPTPGPLDPFPASLNPPSDVQFVLPHVAFVYEEHMRNAYLQAWNFTVEREVASGTIARLAYAASKGTRLVSLREENAAVYAPGVTTATTNQRRPLFPSFSNVTLIEPVGNSTFHSLQATVERRFTKGFSVLSNLMWSKSIDDGSANKATGADPCQSQGHEVRQRSVRLRSRGRSSRSPACTSYR